ncbi:MAG: contact-dependent growth inhibition system immunity protein [Terriglobales bacterium]
MSDKSSNPKPEITAANFPALRSFLRGYFHEDIADEYGTPPEAADQFCEDAETDERTPVAREWQQLSDLTQGQPVGLNAALRKLGSAVTLSVEEIAQVSAIFARCLAIKPHRKAAND